MSHPSHWKLSAITFNVAMKQANEEVIDKMLSHVDYNETDILAIGMQEVAHSETLGGLVWTWQRLIIDWVTMRSSLVLLTKTYQATNQVLLFWRRSLLPQVKRVDYRFGRNTLGGLTGHKGSIGLKISLQSKEALVFVVSHFIHDVAAYNKRLLQFESNKTCTFAEDTHVKGVFWLGDLNFRVELEPHDALTKIRCNKLNEMLGKSTFCNYLEKLESNEQLNRAIKGGDAFEDFKEAPITFKPTYRLKIGTVDFDLKRTPSWCDRILYKGISIENDTYTSLSDVLISDHLPVMGSYTMELKKEAQIQYNVIFEHLPTFYSPLTVVGRFQLQGDFWSRGGSYLDWIGLFPSEILDCTTAVKWIWVATCYEQISDDQKYYVCEFISVQPGKYRLGYYSNYRNCLVGLSKSFSVVEPPSQ